MTISIWRYSHLALAVSSFLLLTLASVSGIILAFEPAAQKVQPYKAEDFDRLSLAESLPAIRKAYPEITDISVDAHQFVTLRGADDEGENIEVYIDPATGKKLGVPQPQSQFFQWVTALHRSLFLKETGRFFIGLTSFLLLLITVSGTALIIQRQRGLKRFFTRIVKENFAQYYHVVLGRLSLVPIFIIALTGTYLSMARFGLVGEESVSHQVDFEKIRTEGNGDMASFAVLKNIQLSEVRAVEFPFSDDPEDYYTIKLKDRELVVNQVNGDVLSEVQYPFSALMTNLSFDLHTGRTSLIWAFIIAVATANILFFIYSGFAITLNRRRGRIKNKFSGDKSEIIILVGSENGTTIAFANAVGRQLNDAGKSYFIAELNSFRNFENARHLLVLTATYGLGDAPTNSSRFLKLLQNNVPGNDLTYSVVGFGSNAYPDFCKFAYDINNDLSASSWAKPLLDIHTVNDKSPDEFFLWSRQWSEKLDLPPLVLPREFSARPKRLARFKVTNRTSKAGTDETFMINFKPVSGRRFQSGDLLAVYPADDYRERLYSIAKIGTEILLSVKLHTPGLGSNFLNDLDTGDSISARLVGNAHFHFPRTARSVVMISNGTGIAPFLGMLNENAGKVPCYLYSGFRSAASCDIYRDFLDKASSNGQTAGIKLAYSREGAKEYVKDILLEDESLLSETLSNDGVIMICGSLAMQQNVLELLEDICRRSSLQELSYFQGRGKILMDCY